ncbi:MAG TPA: beta-ketoacyl synthase N-terminal-like domain-containing protein [Polyangiaceae bacterium]|nr:beta-ketoacyl synthase N-terminal-like domain-containing protein [Polyangiaceae bacterium]
MTPVAVVARGAVSALGAGSAATHVGDVGKAPGALARDDLELARAGLRKPRAARAAVTLSLDGADRARTLLELVSRELAARLDVAVPRWQRLRLALAVGTSAGGLGSLERALALRAEGAPLSQRVARDALYDGPLDALDASFGHGAPRVQLLGACIASTFALGLAARWLDAGHADLVIAGGYDALCPFLAAGFEALGATTGDDPAPFRAARDGMVLGEGAALVALMRAADAPSAEGFVLGFGAASDARHVTAPDPEGRGLARAARRALADAGVDAGTIELVSAHATATPHNDAAEAAALRSVFGAHLARVPVHPFKGVIGHTLGAAGALESLAALDAMRHGILPGAVGNGAVDAVFGARLLDTNVAGHAARCLKLSAAFGGANAALVLSTEPADVSGARSTRDVTLLATGPLVTAPDLELLAARTRLDELRRSRLDRASALAVTAAASVLAELPELDPETTAVIVGTSAASLEADEGFDQRRRERGAAFVEPRRFPATSPNLPAGWCAIAFGWQGPSVAVGGGPGAAEQALLVAYDLVAAGDAEHAVVITCDDVGPVTCDLYGAARLEPPRDGARALVLGVRGGPPLRRPVLTRADPVQEPLPDAR